MSQAGFSFIQHQKQRDLFSSFNTDCLGNRALFVSSIPVSGIPEQPATYAQVTSPQSGKNKGDLFMATIHQGQTELPQVPSHNWAVQ